VAKGSPFTLRVRSSTVDCRVAFDVQTSSETAFHVIRTTSDGVSVSVDTATTNAHYFTVTSRDDCGVEANATFNVFVTRDGRLPPIDNALNARNCTRKASN
jgi:riboflavin biosynthesis pyrimidine reductase